MPMLEEETLRRYGYSASAIAKSSQTHKVWCRCDKCAEEFPRTRRYVHDALYTLCKSCVRSGKDPSRYVDGVKSRKAKAPTPNGGWPKSQETIAKARSTNNERHGGTGFESATIRAKNAEAAQLKWGKSHHFKNKNKLAEMHATMEKRHGVKTVLQLPHVVEARKKRSIEVAGTENPFCSPTFQTYVQKQRAEVGYTGIYGEAEQDLADLIASWGVSLVSGSHKVLPSGKQIDILSHERGLAVEYCGLHWHCENSKAPRGRLYHKTKFDEVNAAGYRLITIFEDEWLDRQQQVANFLRSAFGVSSIKINARKCSVQLIDVREALEFVDKNHIQPLSKGADLAVGLTYENTLVGVMVFGPHHRLNDKSTSVLKRMCFTYDTTVRGGASKMCAFAVKELRLRGVTKIISWSDNRWSEGTVYDRMGFTLAATLPPDFSYVQGNGRKRLSKQSQRKSTVKCPPGTTEREWSKQRLLSRIWDCGKKRWKLKL